MEYLRRVYEQLAEYDPFSFTLCLAKAQDIIENISPENKDAFSFSTSRKLSKGEKYILGAKRIKDITLETGKIVDTNKDYVYGYQDLSYEEFISYIFWRTQIRKRKTIYVPSRFLALYLIEIVNFVEIEKVEDGLEIIKFLELLSADMESNLRQIKKAREEFLFYYGTVEETESIIDYSNFYYFFEDDKIINKNHPSLLECFCNRHYTAFLKSKMYLQYADKLENDFYDWFYSICNYFSTRKINLLDLYCGDEKYIKMESFYIKKIVQGKIIIKEIYLNNTPIIKVSGEVDLLTKHFTDGTIRNKEHIYIRSVVTKYLLRLYECKKRKELKFPKTYPSVSELHKGFCNIEIAEQIETIFESEEFNQLYMY